MSVRPGGTGKGRTVAATEGNPGIPDTLAEKYHAAYLETVGGMKSGTAPQVAEMIAVQIQTARDCRARIDRDGFLVADSRGNPIPHPAIDMEAAAQSRATKLLADFWSRQKSKQ